MKKGERMPLETKLKISAKLKGVKKSQKMRMLLGLSRKGKKLSFEHKMKLKENHVGMTGKKHSLETREKMRKAALGRPITESQKEKMRGAKNRNWKGGISGFNKLLRMSDAFRKLRKAVFARDNYTCVICGYRSKGVRPPDIHLDHIMPFAYFPNLRFSEKNCRTLCISCHKKTDTWGYKSIKNYGKNV